MANFFLLLALFLGSPLLLAALASVSPVIVVYALARAFLPVPSLGLRRMILGLVQAHVTGTDPGEPLHGCPSPLTDLGGPHYECPSPLTDDDSASGPVSPDGLLDGNDPALLTVSTSSSASASTPDSPLSDKRDDSAAPVVYDFRLDTGRSWADLVEEELDDEDTQAPAADPEDSDGDTEFPAPEPILLDAAPIPMIVVPVTDPSIPGLTAEWECKHCGAWSGGHPMETGPDEPVVLHCSNPACQWPFWLHNLEDASGVAEAAQLAMPEPGRLHPSSADRARP